MNWVLIVQFNQVLDVLETLAAHASFYLFVNLVIEFSRLRSGLSGPG
jgi:hypothetical protein